MTPIQGAPDSSSSTILEALRRENDTLRRRLTETERDYNRVTRMNDIYREELIQHRTRVSHSLSSAR
ncbi:hypothetical protein DL93DRAFT_2086172 [Clavulina sp. PMI_390]|nr:hypothetical protein DL93DRAFT_2086172 [Clavulina sp. PMI_390]